MQQVIHTVAVLNLAGHTWTLAHHHELELRPHGNELTWEVRGLTESTPQEDWSLSRRMSEFRDRFTPSESKVADYLYGAEEKVAFLTAKEISEAVGVSESTVVRFARTLGYENYRMLVDDVRESIRARITRSPQSADTWPSAATSNITRFLSTFQRQELENLERTYATLSATDYDELVTALAGARHIYVAGTRTSRGVAVYAAFALNLLRPGVLKIDEGGSQHLDSLMSANEQDVLLALAVSRVSRSTYESVQFAHGHGVRIGAIIDSVASPVAHFADWPIIVQRESPGPLISYTAAMSVLHALATTLSERIGTSAQQRLASLDQVLENQDLVIH